MKTILLLAATMLLSGCVTSPRYDDRYGKDYYEGRYDKDYYIEGSEQQRVLVCHKGKKTMELPVSALNGHMGHGDHRGPCR